MRDERKNKRLTGVGKHMCFSAAESLSPIPGLRDIRTSMFKSMRCSISPHLTTMDDVHGGTSVAGGRTPGAIGGNARGLYGTILAMWVACGWFMLKSI